MIAKKTSLNSLTALRKGIYQSRPKTQASDFKETTQKVTLDEYKALKPKLASGLKALGRMFGA